MCRHDDDAVTISTTSGRAIPGVEVLVVDDDGAEVPRGEPGEVVVRGYNVMRGYFEDPEQTAETIDADGWLHTGDIGTMDERGYLRDHRPQEGHVHHRRVQRLPGRDREPAARPTPTSPRSRSSACPTSGWARSAWPSWCRSPAPRPTPDEIVAWAREHMANFKAPRHVRIVDALPMNASNKVLKTELRAQAAAAVES